MVKTAVVILNWNGIGFLQRFLPGVVKFTGGPDVEVIVADNGSKDGSQAWIRQNFPELRIIELDKNYGFAEGYNRSLRQIEAAYYVLLNSDVEVTQDWLDPLTHFMDTHPGAGACMPKIKALENRKSFEYAGAAGGFIDRYGYPFCRGRIFNVTEYDEGQYDKTIPVFWASGACYVVRSALYHETGGLDADFFAHMEEIDLSWRIQCRGFSIHAIHESEVYHLGGGSLNQQHPMKTFLNFRNNLYLLVKNLPPKILLRRLLIRMILDGIAGIKFLAGMEIKNFIAVIRAHFSFYAHFPAMIRKRRAAPSCKKLPETMYAHNITWQFFIKGKRFFRELPK
ncbi:MAG: glycosyltransferase [Chlorobi bacterium]|nr:glycosyltransferase [Chlorobiota bacterium]